MAKSTVFARSRIWMNDTRIVPTGRDVDGVTGNQGSTQLYRGFNARRASDVHVVVVIGQRRSGGGDDVDGAGGCY